MEQAFDPNQLYCLTRSNSFLSKDKEDIINAYLKIKRSCEEICLLKTEMKNVLEYYSIKLQRLQDLIKDYRLHDSAFGRGAVSQLKALSNEVNLQLMKCSKLFSFFLSSTENDWNCDDGDYSDDSSSDEDDDKTDDDENYDENTV